MKKQLKESYQIDRSQNRQMYEERLILVLLLFNIFTFLDVALQNMLIKYSDNINLEGRLLFLQKIVLEFKMIFRNWTYGIKTLGCYSISTLVRYHV